MTQNRMGRMRQLVDWRATVIAGISGGVAFLLTIALVLPATTGGSLWAFFRYVASIILGKGVLPPSTGSAAAVVVVGLLIHLVLSLIFAVILTTIIHRWGLLVGLFAGALYGLAVYAINFFTFTLFFDWFYLLRSWPILLAHVVYGAVTGFVYELLEVERFVPVEAEA